MQRAALCLMHCNAGAAQTIWLEMQKVTQIDDQEELVTDTLKIPLYALLLRPIVLLADTKIINGRLRNQFSFRSFCIQ